MSPREQQGSLAVLAARLYYYQGLTTEAVAGELNFPRPKVSRLLSFAKQTGLVEVRIHDAMAQPQRLEQDIQRIFGIPSVRVVAVPSNSSEDEWLQRVATFSANHLNGLVHSRMTIGIAWGTTFDSVSLRLVPKPCKEGDIRQLNCSP